MEIQLHPSLSCSSSSTLYTRFSFFVFSYMLSINLTQFWLTCRPPNRYTFVEISHIAIFLIFKNHTEYVIECMCFKRGVGSESDLKKIDETIEGLVWRTREWGERISVRVVSWRGVVGDSGVGKTCQAEQKRSQRCYNWCQNIYRKCGFYNGF